MDIETLITGGSYAAIFLLMIANGLISLPSSQALYIIVGYFVFKGTLSPVTAIIFGALGNTVGNIALYEIIRTYGRPVIGKFRIFDPRILAKVEVAVAEKGWWFLFFGKLLPAIKVFVPIPAGLGKMHRGWYAVVMLLASIIWASGFTAIGFYFGKSFKIFGWYGIGIMVVAVIVVLLFLRYVEHVEIKTANRKRDENNAALTE